MSFKNKSILLAITSDRGFYKCFSDNLKHLGFTVFLLRELPFCYECKKDQVFNFIQKTFFRNKNYKKKLIANNPKNNTHQNTVLNKIKSPVDYSLTIRADIFKDDVLHQIIKKSKKAYAYQWDGLNRFPEVIKRMSLFEKFYVFDKADVKVANNTSLTTNFYFDCYANLFKNKNPEYDVFYIGTYDSRIPEIIKLCKQLHNIGLKLNIIIICNKQRQKKLSKYPFFTLPKQPLSYYENLQQVANTKAILEFGHINLHSGLSFRAFEALGYNKKLITNNTAIKEYDFYEKENFHVYKNLEELSVFLNTPSIKIEDTIKQYYSFSSWIKRILEIV